MLGCLSKTHIVEVGLVDRESVVGEGALTADDRQVREHSAERLQDSRLEDQKVSGDFAKRKRQVVDVDVIFRRLLWHFTERIRRDSYHEVPRYHRTVRQLRQFAVECDLQRSAALLLDAMNHRHVKCQQSDKKKSRREHRTELQVVDGK